MNTSGHHVLVVGGSSGIGLSLAKRFLCEGNHVVVVGRTKEKLKNVLAECPGLEIYSADVTSEVDRKKLAERYPDTTILINSAGTLNNDSVLQCSNQALVEEVSINMIAPMCLSLLFLPILSRSPDSAIVFISSNLAFAPKASAAGYSASKAGLRNFAKSFRWQTEGTSVKVFEAIPSIVDTPMTEQFKKSKISVSSFTEQFWSSFANDQYEILIGNAKLVSKLHRFFPCLLDYIMRRSE
ncbi:MAG: SDR family NAD(P)-dependent oxidoreductase [Candidatus Thiodiazotropha sp.]